MAKWYYFVAAELLVLTLVIIALFFPWYSLDHKIEGSLEAKGHPLYNAEIRTIENMDIWEDWRVHEAESNSEIFGSSNEDTSSNNYGDMPHVRKVMRTAGILSFTVAFLSLASILLFGFFIFFKKKRKRLKRSLAVVSILVFATGLIGSLFFYSNMAPAVNDDIEHTIYPGLFDPLEEGNVSVPDLASSEQKKFEEAHAALYPKFKNETVYYESFYGSDSERYDDSYAKGSIELHVKSTLQWGPSFGWYLIAISLFPALVGIILAILLDRNMPIPFHRYLSGLPDEYDVEDHGDDDETIDHRPPPEPRDGFITIEEEEEPTILVKLKRK